MPTFVRRITDRHLLNKVRQRRSFFDKKALERNTGVTKKKYKLAGYPLPREMGLFPFFITTTNESSCKKLFTVTVETSDWEYRKGPYHDCRSFVDIQKFETLSRSEVLTKMRDESNRFQKVGVLKKKKFDEIQALRERIPRAYANVSRPVQQLMARSLTDAQSERVDDVLGKLGLS